MKEQESACREISAAEIEAVAAGFVVAVGQEDRLAEAGSVRVGPEGSPVLEEGTSLVGEDRKTEEEHLGSREDQREDRSVSFPGEEEGSRMEGKVGAVEGPEDLGDRAIAAVVAAGWAGGRRPGDQMVVLEERRVRHEVLRPDRMNVSIESNSSRSKMCSVVWLRRKATESVHMVLRSRKMTMVYIRNVSSQRLSSSWVCGSNLHRGWRGHWAPEEAEACSPWEARRWSGP